VNARRLFVFKKRVDKVIYLGRSAVDKETRRERETKWPDAGSRANFSRAAPSHLLKDVKVLARRRTITVANLGVDEWDGVPDGWGRGASSYAPMIGVPGPGTRSFRC
jgi:hypothetical protein